MTRSRYAIITPVRNESSRIGRTIESIRRQRVPPTAWIVVDDGSSDDTAVQVEAARATLPQLRLVRRADRGHDAVGGGVIEGFQLGAAQLDFSQLDFIAKVDGDIVLGPDYFAQLIARMQSDPSIGLCSGQSCVELSDGARIAERFRRFHPVGSARLWRVADFVTIGGLVAAEGWDTIDVVRLRMRGRRTVVFDDLDAIHLRAMGSREDNLRGGVERLGRISWRLGYSHWYFLMRALAYATRRPIGVRAWWLVRGYIAARASGDKRLLQQHEVRWLRHFQLRQLFGLQENA